MAQAIEPETAQDRRLQRLNWTIITSVAAADLLWIAAGGFGLDAASFVLPLVAVAALVLLERHYRQRRSDLRIAAALTGLAQFVGFSMVGAPLSYLAASRGSALWDQRLYDADRWLGLDWPAYLGFVDAHPWLGLVLTIAYRSIMPQMIVALIALCFTGRFRAARIFVFGVVVAGLVSILVSGAMPAMAMFVHLHLQPSDYPHLSPAADFVHVAGLEAMRAGGLRTISLTGAEGIITFPSYHAALAVVFMAAFWSVPRLRWPGLVLNLAMIAATPIDGGHYFVDVAAGIVLVLPCLAAARAILGAKRAGTGPAIWSRGPGGAPGGLVGSPRV